MFALLILALAAVPSLPQAPAAAAATGGEWGGARIVAVALSDTERELAGGAGAALRFEEPQAGHFADRSGFRHGDLLVAIDGEVLGDDPAAAWAGFQRHVAAVHTGLVWRVLLLRPLVRVAATRDGTEVADAEALLARLREELEAAPDGASVEVRAWRDTARVEASFHLGWTSARAANPVPPARELFGGRRFKPHALAVEIEKRAGEGGLDAANADLRARLARLAGEADASRLSAISLVQREPFLLPDLMETIAAGFERKALGREPAAILEQACEHAAWTLDLAAAFAARRPGGQPARLASGLEPERHLDQLEALLGRAHALREAALAALGAEERAAVAAHWTGLADRFASAVYLFDDPDAARRARNEALIAAGEKVERAALLAAAAELAPLAEPAWLAALAADLERGGCDLGGPIVLRRETGWGTIAIGGRSDDWHRDDDFALLIDLGGDDFYGNNQGATTNEETQPRFGVAALVDVAGNDAYEATHDGAQGCGVLGVGLLVDLAGDDLYRGRRWAQGCGLLGVGMLLDAAGDDDYRAQVLAQGVGAWGAGLLLDLAGDDRYAGHRYAQGVGLAGGLGALLERDGADRYYCKGSEKSGYGTRGVWEGWGQGCGTGFRADASGGCGLLVDEAGADRYEAGNFSQGGGYYFAVGALLDRGKADDLYIGSRYNQGFSAHQAAGYFHEEGGNDRYLTRNAVASGLAWDECVTMFIEDGGDDVYQGGGFSLGASAHNAICVFWERRGDDRYLRGEAGRAGGNDYHGGTSLSVFVDEGRGTDGYPGGANRNGESAVAPEHAIFVDR